MKQLLSLIFLISMAIVVGCSGKIEQSMVIGKYVANHKEGVDSLIVRADSTYTYFFKARDDEQFVNSRRWEFEYSHGEPTIILYNFIRKFPKRREERPFITILPINKTLDGIVRIPIEPDGGYWYYKVEPE